MDCGINFYWTPIPMKKLQLYFNNFDTYLIINNLFYFWDYRPSSTPHSFSDHLQIHICVQWKNSILSKTMSDSWIVIIFLQCLNLLTLSLIFFFIVLVVKVFENDGETHFMYCVFCDFSKNIYNTKNFKKCIFEFGVTKTFDNKRKDFFSSYLLILIFF